MAKTLSMKVRIPGLSATHDFLVPEDMVVQKAIALILRILRDEYPGVSSHSAAAPTLLQASTGLALDRNCTFGQIGILDGDTFILL